MKPNTVGRMNNITQIDFNDLAFSAVKKNPRGGKFINVTIKGSPIRAFLPSLRAPFGVSAPNEQVKDYYLNLSLTPEVQEKLDDFDNRLIDHVAKNSVEFLGKNVSQEVIRDLLLNPIAKSSKDPEKSAKYAKTIKMKISSNEGKNVAPIFVSRDISADVTDIKPGSNISTFVEIGQVWFINGKFGASVKLLQAKLTPSNNLREYIFEDDEEEIDAPIDE